MYTGAANTSYEVYIYTNVNGAPSTGTLEGGLVNTRGSLLYAGYHTIELARPVSLVAGKNFAVVIKITSPGYTYPIPIEYPFGGYDSKAVASAGQSYISANGSSWTDIATVYANTNVDIRAFTLASGTPSTPSTPTAPTASTVAASVITANSARVDGTVNANGATTTVSFDYGPTTDYTATIAATPSSINAGTGNVAVTANLGSLICNTTYHYRVKGVNSAGTTNGADLTLKTSACPVVTSYALTVTKAGTGSGTVAGTGIACGSDCTESYASGTGVSLTATAGSGSTFSGWSGCTTVSGATCAVTMGAAKSVKATFTRFPNTP